jgi:hypothetical protein
MCNSLKSVILNPLVFIGPNAFDSCAKLMSVTFDDSHNNTTNLQNSDSNDCTVIGKHAFYNCCLLMTVANLPKRVVFEDCAFFKCRNLTGAFYVGGPHQPHLPLDLFAHTAIQRLTIAPGTLSIGPYMCYNCTLLNHVTTPVSLQEVHNDAFNECSSLQSIHFGSMCTAIGEQAFGSCIEMHTITIKSEYNVRFGANCFENCTALQEFVVPKQTSVLPYHMFLNCVALHTISGGAALTHISSYCFAHCIALLYPGFHAMPKLHSLGNKVFAECNSIQSIQLHKTSISHIGGSSFSDLKNLQTVSLPVTLSSGHLDMFDGCPALSTIQIPEHTYSTFLSLLLDSLQPSVALVNLPAPPPPYPFTRVYRTRPSLPFHMCE